MARLMAHVRQVTIAQEEWTFLVVPPAVSDSNNGKLDDIWLHLFSCPMLNRIPTYGNGGYLARARFLRRRHVRQNSQYIANSLFYPKNERPIVPLETVPESWRREPGWFLPFDVVVREWFVRPATWVTKAYSAQGTLAMALVDIAKLRQDILGQPFAPLRSLYRRPPRATVRTDRPTRKEIDLAVGQNKLLRVWLARSRVERQRLHRARARTEPAKSV
jgi:hypothetical protein